MVAVIAVTAAVALPTGSAPVAAPVPVPAVVRGAAPLTAAAAPKPAAELDTRRFTRPGRTRPDPIAGSRRRAAAAGPGICRGSGPGHSPCRRAQRRRPLRPRGREAPDGTFGRLLYVGLDRVARADVELLKWTDGKQVIWVNADGVGGEGQSDMRLPVAGRVTSGFGERFHPILGYERFHAGVDLGAAWGSPIVAAADGRVVSAGWRGGYGRAVEIAHASGLETLYGHMSRIAAAPGELVREGEVIGYVGSSGLSTGPHVHFEVLKGGRPINPMGVKMDSARVTSRARSSSSSTTRCARC